MGPASANIGSNIPAFLSKLWNMVNDPHTNHLISWSLDGQSFIIQNQAQFWYSMLPIYYKHNNMSSFIRQLNMYGFHKVGFESGGTECEKDEIKFFHPCFRQNQPGLIQHIKRKITSTKSATVVSEETTTVEQITKVLVDVKQLRGRQESVDSQLVAMKQENAALWRELASLRQKHLKQQQIVNKLIHFLVTIVQPSRGGLGGLGVKRRYPLMINDSRSNKIPKKEETSNGPTIHELDSEVNNSDSLLLNTNITIESDVLTEPQQKIVSALSNTNNITSPKELLDVSVIGDTVAEVNADTLLDTEYIVNEQVADLLEESDEMECIDRRTEDEDEYRIRDSELKYCLIDKDDAADEYIDIDLIKSDPFISTTTNGSKKLNPAEVLINPDMNDTMLSNINPTEYDIKQNGDSKEADKEMKEGIELETTENTIVAMRNKTQDVNTLKLNSVDDFGNHLEATQGELETIKDILFDGGYSLDASSFLGLFSQDDSFSLDISQLDNKNLSNSNTFGLFSGSELMAYNSNGILDFENLFEKSVDADIGICSQEIGDLVNTNSSDELNTPAVLHSEPLFPVTKSDKSK